jgi:GNAT superfamily N-acetyltransferase
MNTIKLAFRPIDLTRHADTCIAFRRDSFVCSFGTDEAFFEESGPDGAGYIHWLSERIEELPEGCVHVWDGETIIGQMEMCVREDPKIGYINLFYLVPSERGGGAGDQLHDYALQVFRRLNISRLQLSVSPANSRAMAYYRKHGWEDMGPRPDHKEVNLMELLIDD